MVDIKAVLFDCDGLMFETELVSQQIWRDEARKLNITLPDDFFMHITGSGGQELENYILTVPGAKELRKILKEKRFDIDFWKSIQKDCMNKVGLIEIFTWLANYNYKVAVCSSSARTYVEALISTVSVPLQYDAIVCGDMVKHAKPDPEIFLTGAKILGINPENCMVLEDSKQGIIAANAAGMHSCFIQDTIQPDSLMESLIEYRKPSLIEVINLLEELKEVTL